MIFREWGLPLLWLCWAAYWALAAARSRPPQRTEARSSRLVHLGCLTVAFLLLFLRPLSVGPLALRFVPDTPACFFFGFGIACVGLAFATWARVHLGPSWSGIIGIRDQHRLTRTGPYALVRHPIYGGLLLAIVGTAIGIGEVGSLVGASLAVIAYVRKTRIEERWLLSRFHAAYEDYRRDVGALFPFLGRSRRAGERPRPGA